MMLYKFYLFLKENQDKILGNSRLTIFFEDGFLTICCTWIEKNNKLAMKFRTPFEELAQSEMDTPDIMQYFVERCNRAYRNEVLKF